MLMNSNCVVCVLNQILRVSDYLKLERGQKDRVFRKVLSAAPQIDFENLTAPEYAQKIYEIFTSAIGNHDPYKPLRKEQNDFVLKNKEFFIKNISNSANRLQAAAYYSLIGNIIDFGSEKLLDRNKIFDKIQNFIPDINDYSEFEQRLRNCRQILIIADNAGEAVFDLFFIREIKNLYPDLKIFYGVRSKPAINDIMENDAHYIGIPEYAGVIPTGSNCAGTIISNCTSEFITVYRNSDMVVAKGQGNYETLEARSEEILFVFKVKCSVVEEYLGIKSGSLIFAFNETIKKQKL